MEHEDIAELIHKRVKIEDVIIADGYPLAGNTGPWRRCSTPNTGGLIVNTVKQYYYWNVQAEGGDVIDWVINRGAHDFKAACEDLARRYNLPDPDWDKGHDPIRRAAIRTRESALGVGAQQCHAMLWESPEAQAYVESRGLWVHRPEGEEGTPSTAAQAMLGYTGDDSKESKRRMREALLLNGIDLDSPGAVALIGYRGDVKRWALANSLEIGNERWIENGYIPGLLDKPRLVYVHREHGRVVYLSTRGIGAEKDHYNISADLVGARRLYYNHEWNASKKACVLVEGQADALSWGQWGVPAIGLNGVTPDKDIAEVVKGYETVYVALDMDVTGVIAGWRLALLMGAAARVLPMRSPTEVYFEAADNATRAQAELTERANEIMTAISGAMRWPMKDMPATKVNGDPVKDSNDLLQAMCSYGTTAAGQAETIKKLLERAPTAAEISARMAGVKDGAEREKLLKEETIPLLSGMDELNYASQKGLLAKLLQIGSRDLDRMLKVVKTSQQKAKTEGRRTWGGYINGWLLEYLYDPETDAAELAWRDPDGKIDSGRGVMIGEDYYLPEEPDTMLRKGSLYFPSALGDMHSQLDLLAHLRTYLNGVYLMPSTQMTELIAYWILQTYLYDCFSSTIYLRVIGDPGAGKSEFMLRVGMACYRYMMASGVDSFSSLFRTADRLRGTIGIDEADWDASDTENEKIKFLNQGAFKGRPILRTKEITLPDGGKSWAAEAFDVFVPKMIGARKKFVDDAVDTRSLTQHLVARETIELIQAGIPLTVTPEMEAQAQALRNLLIRYRLENWKPDIPILPEWYDLTISARLNQVAGPILAMARDDEPQQQAIKKLLRDYYQDTILTRSMTKQARVIEALWILWLDPDLRKLHWSADNEGAWMIKNTIVAQRTNAIMDEMNAVDEENDNPPTTATKPRKDISPHTIANIIRNDLLLKMSDRKRDGHYVYLNLTRMLGLALKYGVKLADIAPKYIHPDGMSWEQYQAWKGPVDEIAMIDERPGHGTSQGWKDLQAGLRTQAAAVQRRIDEIDAAESSEDGDA